MSQCVSRTQGLPQTNALHLLLWLVNDALSNSDCTSTGTKKGWKRFSRDRDTGGTEQSHAKLVKLAALVTKTLDP